MLSGGPNNLKKINLFPVSGDVEKLVKTLHDQNLNFKHSTLEKATDSFNEANKLGQGGFGTVYKVITRNTGERNEPFFLR